MTDSTLKPYPEYRESGVEWLGKIPAHWTIEKLKYNSYVKGRIGWQNLRSDEFIDEGPYLITGMHFTDDGRVDWEECYHISEERYEMAPEIQIKDQDLIITKDGTIGKLAHIDYLPGRASLNSHLLVIRPNTGMYVNRYMYYLLQSPFFREYIYLTQTGTTFYGMSQESFVNFPGLFPPLPEQRTIADFLDRETARIDALIDAKQRLIDLLEEKRSALISHVVTKGLDPDVPMKDSGIEWLGEIPNHWRTAKVRFLFENLDSIRIPLSSEERSRMQGRYPYYGASGIIDYVNDYLFDEPLILVAEDGANLYSRSTPLAFVATGKYWVNNHAHVLRHRFEPIGYWSSVLATVEYYPWITGAAQPKLTQDNLASITLPFPPEEERKAIAEYIASESQRVDPLIDKTEETIRRLNEYRTALISAAVTGKIDVRGEDDVTEK